MDVSIAIVFYEVCERVFYRHFTYIFLVKLLNDNPQIHIIHIYYIFLLIYYVK